LPTGKRRAVILDTERDAHRNNGAGVAGPF
jgi:hypothetical protein